MKILGLDLALRCGWAQGERGAQTHYGVFNLPGFDDANRPRSCASLYSAVQSMIRANNIEGVVIETPLHIQGKSAHTERSLTMLSGAGQAGASSGGAKQIWLVAPSTWRKAVLGHGFPKNPKAASVNYCRTVLKSQVEDHNASDAMCLVEWGHAQARLL